MEPVDSADVVVRTQPHDHVAVLRLNRPAAHNAVNAEVAAALAAHVRDIEDDPAIRAAILTGTGKSFCAGADLKEYAGGRDIRVPRPGGFAGFVLTPRSKPWIAAVNGPAYGGGTELVLACTMSVAAEDATLALSEVKRGLVAIGGGVSKLPLAVPPAIAAEILATGLPMPARRLHQLGLINRLVPREQVLDEALALAAAIGENSPFAVRESLRLARAALEHTQEEMERMCREASHRIFESHDYREGPRAFAEKRPPVWEG